MIQALKKTPRYWLTLEDCALIFSSFKNNLDYLEPIPGFQTRFPGKLEGILESVSQTFNGEYLNLLFID